MLLMMRKWLDSPDTQMSFGAKKYPIILRQIFLLILSGSVFYPHHQDYEGFLGREIST